MRTAALLASALLAAPAGAGSVVGQLQLVEKGGRPSRDASDAVVYLQGARTRARPTRASMAMRGKAFVPRVVAVPVGSTVEFPNDDPIFHNVFSVSGENHFDLDLYKRPRTGAHTFRHPGVVRVYCNIHPQMSAVVLVTDSPFYARARSDGSFRIDGVPPGRYTLKAWHERAGEAALAVDVSDATPSTVELRLDASRYKRVQHKNKFGQDYARDEKY